jgi:hypothetical protein
LFFILNELPPDEPNELAISLEAKTFCSSQIIFVDTISSDFLRALKSAPTSA